MKTQKKLDKLLIGTLIGIIMPLLVFGSIYLIRYHAVPIRQYISLLWSHQLLIKLLSLCAIPNLLFFMLFINTQRLRAARGVLLATFIFAFIVLIYRLIV
jgi:hypothetical protein